MIKIEVKDMICDAEINGEFSEVMTELTLAMAYICKDIAKREKMPLSVVRKSLIAGFKMTGR